MESDKSDEDEHEAISKQIVEYYRKYSQSKQLPKYFSGTSLSYMPKIVKDEEIANPPLIIIDDSNTKTVVLKPADLEELKIVSPASSVASNRKLEWDNGADIGYNYCNRKTLKKSVSLPTLMGAGDFKVKDKSLKKLNSQVVTVISYSSNSDDNIDKPTHSSSSSSYPLEPPQPVESSSSSSPNIQTKPSNSSSSSFATTLAFLKSKIGSPDAESTPKLNLINETPIVPRSTKHKSRKIVNLCITKPVLIECVDSRPKKRTEKKIQTSFIEKSSKCVQTGDSLEFKFNNQTPNNQSIIEINYNSGNTSTNTQTDSELCNSFEYYQQNDLKKTKTRLDSAASDSDIPLLGQLISKKQSKSLVGDIDKSIEILQKLLKSKKYDAATKKRYIKKIVEKIVDSKYEDSTTSSELFVPKKQQKLEENVPRYSPDLSKFTVKTFSDEYLPSQEDAPSSKKKSIFTANRPSFESTSDSYQSWKEDKTVSERIFEEKQKGQGDQLVTFAQKERQNQIAWIDDEISHLTKLRGLLGTTGHRTTTVYMLTEQSEKHNSLSSSGNPRRNYVIETNISPSSSSDAIDFNLYDTNRKTNYHVSETLGRSEKGMNDGLIGDIQVVSNEQTTNIKVTARKMCSEKEETFKPKEPKLVGIGKYDTFPKSRVEEERCWPCGMIQSRRSAISGVAQHYSFDVPLEEHSSSFIKKVDEILGKYSSKSRIQCKCCKCGKHLFSATTGSGTDTNTGTSTRTGTNTGTTPRTNTNTGTGTSSSAGSNKKTSGKEIQCVCCKCVETQTVKDTRQSVGTSNTANEKLITKAVQCKCCKCIETQTSIETTKDVFSSTEKTKKSELFNKNVQCECCECVETQTANTIYERKSKSTDYEIPKKISIESQCECCKCEGIQTTAESRNKFSTGVQYSSSNGDEMVDKNLQSISTKTNKAQITETTKGEMSKNGTYKLPQKLSKESQCECCKCESIQTTEESMNEFNTGVQYDSSNGDQMVDKNFQTFSAKTNKAQITETTKEEIFKNGIYKLPQKVSKESQCECCKCESIQTTEEPKKKFTTDVQYDSSNRNQVAEKNLQSTSGKTNKAQYTDSTSEEEITKNGEFKLPQKFSKESQCECCKCESVQTTVESRNKFNAGVQYDSSNTNQMADKNLQSISGKTSTAQITETKNKEMPKRDGNLVTKSSSRSFGKFNLGVQFDSNKNQMADKNPQSISSKTNTSQITETTNEEMSKNEDHQQPEKSSLSSNKSSTGVQFDSENRNQMADKNLQCICYECASAQTGSDTYNNKNIQCTTGCICRNSQGGETQFYRPSVPGQIATQKHGINASCQCANADSALQTDCLCKEDTRVQTENIGENISVQHSSSHTQVTEQPSDPEHIPSQKYVINASCQCANADSALQTDCICKEHTRVQTENGLGENKKNQAGSSFSQSSTQSSSLSASSEYESISETVRSCLCCKKKNVTEKALYALRKKLSDQAYPFCQPCFRQNRRCAYSLDVYNSPTHRCACYTVVETKTLNEIKKTITDLNSLDEYCTCTNVNNRNNAEYCKYCNCKLKKTSRNKNGIAYLLTFEDASLQEEIKKKRPHLEEIKIKIPTVHKKKHKDKENKRKKRSRSQTESEEYVIKEKNNDDSESVKRYTTTSLEEYLKQNRPDFVEIAEGRRQAVVNSKMQREELSDQNKLMFLQNYLDNKNSNQYSKRLFSDKEMKEITKKNYLKLPEVQQKLIHSRERQIRQANRLMADTFNRKLRENVLKGKRNLSTEVNVLNL